MGKRPGNPLLASKAIILTGGLMLCLVGLTETAWGAAGAAAATAPGGATPWWVWALVLLGFSFLVGILSLLGGMGGGTLFVSIIGGFLPFYLDFVRCASLLVALCGDLSAAPGLLRFGIADLRLSLPAALMTLSGAICGAMIGLRLPTHIVQVALGFTLLGVVVLLLRARRAEYPEVKEPDALSALLGIHGIYLDRATEEEVSWRVHRTPWPWYLFCWWGSWPGYSASGGGWANMAVLNLIMGAPLKVAVGTSKLIASITCTGAAWVYLLSGAVLLVIVIPSVIGIILGSWVGVHILARIAPIRLRYVVIGLLLFAGLRS